jgi:O-antigen/teichoic acid export membrane protein
VHRSIVALAVGTLVSAAMKLLFTHLALPGVSNRFCWDRAAVREIVGFGRWIFVSTVFTFLAGQSDRLIFGKLVALELLGIYGIAATLAAIPSMALGQLRSSVYYPLYARVVVRGEDLASEMRRTRAPLLLAGAWATCGLIAGGPTAMRLLYDTRYAEGGWMVQWVALGLWFLLLESLNGVGLLALGRPKWVAAGSFVKFAGMAALIPLGYGLAGFPGAVAAVALSEMLRYLVSCLGSEAAGIRCWPRDLLMTGLLVLWAAAVRLLIVRLSGTIPIGVEAALVTVLVTLAFLPLGWRYLRVVAARLRRAQRP